MKKKILTVIAVILFLASYFVNATTMIDASVSAVNVIYSAVCLLFFVLVLILLKDDRRVLIGSCVFWGIALVCAILTVISILWNLQLGLPWICILICLSPYYGICGIFRDAAFSGNQPMLIGYEVSLLIIPLLFIILITVLLYGKKKSVIPLDTSDVFIDKN